MSVDRDLTDGAERTETHRVTELAEDDCARLGRAAWGSGAGARERPSRAGAASSSRSPPASWSPSSSAASPWPAVSHAAARHLRPAARHLLAGRTSTARPSAAPAVAKSSEDEPDLIAVASDGKKGYCYKTDLDGAATRRPRLSRRRDDSRTLRGMLRLRDPQVRVRRHDADRRVLDRRVAAAGGSWRSMTGPGDETDRRRPRHAHHDGTRPPDGAITITREWLGRPQDHQLGRGRSEPEPAGPRPRDRRPGGRSRSGSATTALDAARPHLIAIRTAPDWLAERMSAAARAAGDPAATARWTLTYRRSRSCLLLGKDSRAVVEEGTTPQPRNGCRSPGLGKASPHGPPAHQGAMPCCAASPPSSTRARSRRSSRSPRTWAPRSSPSRATRWTRRRSTPARSTVSRTLEDKLGVALVAVKQ